MRNALQLADGSARDQALHDTRKAAKRARYAAEAVSTAGGKKVAKSAKALKKMQTLLGEQHDAVIAGRELRLLALRAHADGENTFTYGLLHERQHERARRLDGRARHAWKRARTRLKAAV